MCVRVCVCSRAYSSPMLFSMTCRPVLRKLRWGRSWEWRALRAGREENPSNARFPRKQLARSQGRRKTAVCALRRWAAPLVNVRKEYKRKEEGREVTPWLRDYALLRAWHCSDRRRKCVKTDIWRPVWPGKRVPRTSELDLLLELSLTRLRGHWGHWGHWGRVAEPAFALKRVLKWTLHQGQDFWAVFGEGLTRTFVRTVLGHDDDLLCPEPNF